MTWLGELLEKLIAAREAQVNARLRAEGHLLNAKRAEFDIAPAANDELGGKRREAA